MAKADEILRSISSNLSNGLLEGRDSAAPVKWRVNNLMIVM
jgi:hypothetical protein